jgi:hypothetical protein|nr:hypothetical protein [uncultured Flavobacterium sp.]
MKNHFLVLLLLVLSINGFGQDTLTYSSTHSQIFGLSPLSKKIDNVNGLVLGLGHVENRNIENQTINGFNVEANPAPIVGALTGFMSLMYLPEIIEKNKKHENKSEHNFIIKNWNYTPNLKINGLNISTGCFFTTTNMNGLNISLGNKFKNFNGISIAPLGTISDKINGLSIGIINANTNLKGGTFGLYNQTYELKGFQFGIVNQAEKNKGIQLGAFNKSYSRGLQLGIWNTNSKHSFPIINW